MGRLERKLLAILVLVAGLPLVAAYWLSGDLVERSIAVGLNPKIASALEDAVHVYSEFVTAEKARQRAIAGGLATSHALTVALESGDRNAAHRLLVATLTQPRVLSIELLPSEHGRRMGARPIRVERPAAETTRSWLTDGVEFPLVAASLDEAPFQILRFEYGLPAEFMRRFEEMESAVIAPFHALGAHSKDLTDIYAWSFVGSLGAAVLAASLLGIVVGRRITRRLFRLRLAMEGVAAGDLTTRLTPEGHDEVADLARGFNQMATRLGETYARVEYLTRVSAWQGIARRLAHEIKNPLTPILLAVQQVHSRYRGSDSVFREVVDTAREVVEQEVATLQRLVENFSNFARLPTVQLRPEDLVTFARDIVAAHPELDGLRFETPSGRVDALIDRGLLRQALTNLLKNAAEAAKEVTAQPEIALTVEQIPPDPTVGDTSQDGLQGSIIRIADNGPGIPPADRDRVFEPYVTGKPTGTGLGLAIVKKIVLDHGGRVRVVDGPLGGAAFEIELPARSTDAGNHGPLSID